MKSQYKKPLMNVIEITSCMLFATSTLDINSYSQGEFKEDFAKSRRGTWGDLWAKEEQ